MILLYRDPYGKNLSVAAHHIPSDPKPSNGIENAKTAELEKKVVSLEKTVLEGERTIAELRQRIETLTKEKNLVQVAMFKSLKHEIDNVYSHDEKYYAIMTNNLWNFCRMEIILRLLSCFFQQVFQVMCNWNNCIFESECQ